MFLSSTSGNYEDGYTSDQDTGESANLNDENNENASLMSTSSTDPPQSNRKVLFKTPSKPSKITPFQESLNDSLTQATKTIQSPNKEPEDADKSYLLSLLPDYRALPTSKSGNFGHM